MQTAVVVLAFLSLLSLPTFNSGGGGGAMAQVLTNGGFESVTADWLCPGGTCANTEDARRSGQYGYKVMARRAKWVGPKQLLSLTCGQPSYTVSGYMKLLTGQGGQRMQLTANFVYADNSQSYSNIDVRNSVAVADGWVQMTGTLTLPSQPFETVSIYFAGPDPGVDFAVDDVTVTPMTCTCEVPKTSEELIDELRKSDINVQVATGANIDKSQVEIEVTQTKKSFPFGTAVNAKQYNANGGGGRYPDLIHQHFDWAVLANALKWRQIERTRGNRDYQRALDALSRLRSNGLKVRGHTLLWSVEDKIQGWVKQLSGDELRKTVKQHIEGTLNATKGQLEHWDVNNENVHGQWYQDRLGDPTYNQEMFRIAHHHDIGVKLFLNDYNVVSNGYSTDDYLEQALEVKAAYVGLYGIGTQCHFGFEVEPDPALIKERLDKLSQAGLPIWVTELDVQSANETKRADFYEAALRALYSHPQVEGILIWGIWDQVHWRGENAALFVGDNLQITEAGVRVLDLFDNVWMTKERLDLSQAGDQFVVRGFHGDYQVRVYYNGQERTDLATTFTLAKEPSVVNINIQ